MEWEEPAKGLARRSRHSRPTEPANGTWARRRGLGCPWTYQNSGVGEAQPIATTELAVESAALAPGAARPMVAKDPERNGGWVAGGAARRRARSRPMSTGGGPRGRALGGTEPG